MRRIRLLIQRQCSGHWFVLVLLASLRGGTGGCPSVCAQDVLSRMQYGVPEATADLGVGLWAWPLPLDFDGDGNLDLVVSCPDVPFNGLWWFENTGDDSRLPTFRPPVRLGPAVANIQLSALDPQAQQVRILAPNVEFVDFRERLLEGRRELGLPVRIDPEFSRYRANQWRLVDIDADGDQDLIIAIEVWDHYGWDDAWNDEGTWVNGPLHGYVYLLINEGTDNAPRYAPPVKIEAAGQPIDVYGMPSPCFADFDGDGDLDLICGEFLDGFTWFENTGTAERLELAEGRRLPMRMDLQMITPVAVDWDRDGNVDLICGDEDGRVAFLENLGRKENGLPLFAEPVYFRQQAADVKFGALVTPVSIDFDGDGDEDLICGNTAGYIGFIENLGGGSSPRWAEPRLLTVISEEAGGTEVPIRHQAGPQGSIQGPCEAKWGYTTLSVADWDHDGLLDLVVNDIWGLVVWYRNVGEMGVPRFAPAEPLQVAWEGLPPKPEWTWWTPEPGTLVTQWRTTPVVVDWTGDGLLDLIMLDHEGYLVLFDRTHAADGSLLLLPPQRCFAAAGPCDFDSRHRPVGERVDSLLRLNAGRAGASGRRKFCCVDWDGDGQLDLLVNSENVNLLLNRGQDDAGRWWFEDAGPMTTHRLAGHTTSPTVADWNGDGIPELIIGAEDGYFYLLPQQRTQTD